MSGRASTESDWSTCVVWLNLEGIVSAVPDVWTVECCIPLRTRKLIIPFVEHCTSVFYRYSEDSLRVVTQDSMTIREIGEILCSSKTFTSYYWLLKSCFEIVHLHLKASELFRQVLRVWYLVVINCNNNGFIRWAVHHKFVQACLQLHVLAIVLFIMSFCCCMCISVFLSIFLFCSLSLL